MSKIADPRPIVADPRPIVADPRSYPTHVCGASGMRLFFYGVDSPT